MSNIAIETVKLDQSAPVELYVLDLAPLGGPVYRFAPQANELGVGITWAGQVYELFPIKTEGFEQRAGGTLPRPRVTASNVLGSLGPLIRQYDYLRGAKLTRRRTLAKYLDAVNFAAGNAGADPAAEHAPELWIIDRTVSRNRLQVQWELCSPLDFAGVMLPGRTVQPNYCSWTYRGSDCGYTGGPVAKHDDTPTASMGEDRCSKRLTGCQLRFVNVPLPASFFPGVGQMRQL